MTQAKPSDYWFSTTALWIQLNAAGDRNYIDANCGSAAAVLVYMKGLYGLGYGRSSPRLPPSMMITSDMCILLSPRAAKPT